MARLSIFTALRAVLALFAAHRDIDGMRISALFATERPTLDRAAAALALIRQHDKRVLQRIRRDVKRIWIEPLIAVSGAFERSTGRCCLDDKFVAAAPILEIATTIIHEAAHAHPCLRKLSGREALRYRIERVCMRRELAFVRTLPDSPETLAERQRLQRYLSLPPANWSPKQRHKQRVAYVSAELQKLGLPSWFHKPSGAPG